MYIPVGFCLVTFIVWAVDTENMDHEHAFLEIPKGLFVIVIRADNVFKVKTLRYIWEQLIPPK